METFPVKIVIPQCPDFEVDPGSQCVFEVIIPLDLPRIIDPSIPPPPYHGEDELFNRLQPRVRPVTTSILAGLLTAFMGNDYPIHSVLGFDPSNDDFDIVQGRDLLEKFEGEGLWSMSDLIIGPDLRDGRWKDQFGIEGQGRVDAFYEHFDGFVTLVHAFKYTLILGPFEFVEEQLQLDNPRMIQFTAGDQLEDGKVVFVAKEYTEKARFWHHKELMHYVRVQDTGMPSHL